MAAYEYQAMDARGRRKKGVLEGDNERQIRQQLREKGLIPLSVEEAAGKDKGPSSGSRLFQGRVSVTDLALISRQLSTLVASGLPLEQCLLAVAEQTDKPRLQKMLMSVRSKVVEGYTLAEGMRDFPQIFDDLYCAMVAAGEKSGHLDEVLDRLADYTEQRQQTRSQIQQASVYPAVLTLVAVAVIIFLLASVVPEIVSQFADQGQQLPGVTLFLIALSDFVRDYGLFLGLLIVVLLVAFKRMMNQASFRYKVHRKLLYTPFVGRIIRGVNTARFARTLSILTASAVPLLESLKITASVMSNMRMREVVDEACDRVREGSSLRAALADSKLFPPMMLHMIASGEKSGELEQMLRRCADNQDNEFSNMVNVSLKIFEPALIITMAGVVLFIVLAIIQPIMALNQQVGL
ncbi:type II secretion system protein GspF [Aliidiomarina sedimenti]|uniref:Type II secretion system protein GspF n=1 Tax=Aliidiomarina sedimenti TaxID=1933879 RepID=A0ABY0BYS0_9GAMM|nr:type II secretion system inner membrane protein GspF [Aliidiomarina sedimenti]RUO29847.1 type II secretion system protein GspF [Aliidiomarina sedimenti]